VNAARRRLISHSANPDRADFDYFLTASDGTDELSMTGQTWGCGVEKLPALSSGNERTVTAAYAGNHQAIAQGITGTQSYAMAVEVETDDEFYANAGSNLATATNYVTNLTGAVSTIYNRDLHTNVVLQNAHIYTGGAGTDPWTGSDAFQGIAELGNYYHTNHLSLKRSAAIMLSGKNIPSGVAWEGTIGIGDSPTTLNAINTYSGGYAWCGGIGNLFGSQGIGTVPDPNATSNGTQYGMPGTGVPGPGGIQGYWPLEEFAHELGHNLAGHHTHCVAITSGEAAGTNHPGQLFVDMCHTGEIDDDNNGHTAACATGTDYSSAPAEKGTIMSYCHNIFISSVPQSRFTFGQAAEVSHHELDDYMLRAAGPLPLYGGQFNIVTAVGTFTMSTITASSSVGANSTGNTASVTTTNGGSPTFSWTITGGTITSASNIASITYTAGASGNVVLRATAYKNGTNGSAFPNGGVGVTDTKTVTINTCTAPTITGQPAPVSTVTGQDASLSVTASGSATLTYQWYTGNSGNTSSPIGGATSANVVVSPAATTSYWVRVTNGCGSADSATVTVTVTTNPSSVATLFYPRHSLPDHRHAEREWPAGRTSARVRRNAQHHRRWHLRHPHGRGGDLHQHRGRRSVGRRLSDGCSPALQTRPSLWPARSTSRPTGPWRTTRSSRPAPTASTSSTAVRLSTSSSMSTGTSNENDYCSFARRFSCRSLFARDHRGRSRRTGPVLVLRAQSVPRGRYA
jgi:hypothetical protein